MTDFEQGYRMGWAAGWDVGRAHGITEEGAAWTAIFTGCAETWRRPNYDELQAKRDEVIVTPCAAKCRSCSRCARYAAWWRNGKQDWRGVGTADVIGEAVA